MGQHYAQLALGRRLMRRIAPWLALSTCALAQSAAVRILSLEPTVLFPAGEPLRQIAILQTVNESTETIPARITVRVSGQSPVEDIPEALPPGVSSHRVLIPDLAAPAEVKIELKRRAGGEILAAHSQPWQPQRHWKTFIVLSSHEDLGYEDFIYKKQHDIADYIDLAHHLSAPAGPAPDARYHYTLESLLFARNYIEERSETAWRQVVEKDIKTGRMELMGAPSGVHSHWMDYEELARMTYPARREAKDRYGLDLKTFMIVDNPSLSWSGCQAVADAGFLYVARWGQSWRTGSHNDYRTTQLPALFWWQAPDGRHRVLFGWRSHYGLAFWFGQPGGGYQDLVDVGAENVNRRLRAVENGTELGPYPYDAIVTPMYSDHEIPHFDTRVLQAWKLRYRYPEINIGRTTVFFEYVEQKYGSSLPVLSGDLNNFSADYATIDPESQGWKRRAARLLPLAEGLSVLAGRLDAAYPAPQRMVNQAFQGLFDYDEHSWPTQPQASDVHLFNAAWIKKAQAARSLAQADDTLESAFRGFARHIATGDAPMVMVFNPLAHERTDVASIGRKVGGLRDTVTGRPVATEVVGDRTIFIAENVPAFGYRLYRVAPEVKAAAGELGVTADTLENRYYRLRFDRKTGAIDSILDKESSRELVDPKAPHRFNQMIYVHAEGAQSGQISTSSPAAAARMGGRSGAVQAEFTVEIHDEKTGGAITQRAILYRGLKRIDIVDSLRHMRALYSDRYEDRYRDNIYYAFPVDVPGFESRAEYPGGTVRPYQDQLRWGSHDYLSANRWVDTSNRSFGVTMAPWNEAIVSFGGIRYNRFSIDYKPASSYLYSYAYSNRMAGLLTLNPDDCNATLGYSFTSHAGDWASGGATQFGWSVASPLEARWLPAHQPGTLREAQAGFLSVDAPDVQLVTLKPSEQPGRGWIVRLVETEGKSAHAIVRMPGAAAASAWECSLAEEDRRPLAVENGIAVDIGPYAFATIRVLAGASADRAVTGLQGEAISDKSTRLRWQGRAGAAYNIYRADDPDDPPTVATLAARTAEPQWVDDWLNLDTTYYYRVAEVDRNNQQGPVSAAVAVRTRRENVSPPAPVKEAGVVRRAPDRLIVYWRTSPEPDIARYFVYRGKRADFAIDAQPPVAVVNSERYFLQTFADRGLRPGTTYYYRVLPEDWAGNRQQQSPTVSATTPMEVSR